MDPDCRRLQSGPSGDLLGFLAALYLLIPALIFSAGWFIWPVASCFWMLALYLLHPLLPEKISLSGSPRQRQAFLILMLMAAVWALFSGGVHMGSSPRDWLVRDAVLADLTYGDWPTAYRLGDESSFLLRSAIGYFLPPALLGKIFGLEVLKLALFVWTWFGIVILFALLPLPQRSTCLLVISLFVLIFFSGADVIGSHLVLGNNSPEFPQGIEWWISQFTYPCLSSDLRWAPNHAIPSWILMAIVYRYRNHSLLLPLMLSCIPSSFIWSPFASGVVPFVLLALFQQHSSSSKPSFVWSRLMSASAIGILLLWFLSLGAMNLVSSDINYAPYFFKIPEVRAYVLFATWEFGVVIVAILTNTRIEADQRPFFLLSSAILLFLPFLAFGPSNDASLHLSKGPVLLLAIFCIQAIDRPLPDRPLLHKVFFVLIIGLGAVTPLRELAQTLLRPRWDSDYSYSLLDRTDGKLPPHYFADMNNSANFAFINILKPPRWVPARSERNLTLPGG